MVEKPFISPWVAMLAAGRCRIARRVSAGGFGPFLPDATHWIRRSFRADDPWLAMVTGETWDLAEQKKHGGIWGRPYIKKKDEREFSHIVFI